MTEREEALGMTYKSVAHRVPFGAEAFVQAMQGWDVMPVRDGQELIGSILSKENEVHIGLCKKPRSSIGRYIRAAMRKAIDNHGFAITSVQAQNSEGLRFCERLGFVKVGEKGGSILLCCDRSKYT